MDNRAEVREFLLSRRAKITPQQAGLPDIGARRVPGLRRGEVAALAGVSVEYYSKLERGAIAGVSASVLDAIARALRLDDAERAHLFHLAHAADGTSAGMRPRRRPANAGRPGPACSGCSTAFTAPAIVRNGRMDLLAANHLGRAMHAAVYEAAAGGQPNFARFTFLDLDAAHDFYPDWDAAADTCVAILRTEAGRDPHDKDLHDLVGELSTRSDDFRRRWSSPQRPLPRRRHQAFPPPRRRRPRTRLREHGHDLRPRPHPHPLRRRTRLTRPPTPSTCSRPGPQPTAPRRTPTRNPEWLSDLMSRTRRGSR